MPTNPSTTPRIRAATVAPGGATLTFDVRMGTIDILNSGPSDVFFRFNTVVPGTVPTTFAGLVAAGDVGRLSVPGALNISNTDVITIDLNVAAGTAEVQAFGTPAASGGGDGFSL